MNHRFLHFIGIVMMGFQPLFSQTVKSVDVFQETKTIIVTYELISESSCQINLLISKDKGKTWIGPVKNVSGDVGSGIKAGKKQITFDVVSEFNEFVGDDILFRVEAIGNVPIKIGDQYWMTENLDVAFFRNGDSIKQVKTKAEWETASKEGIPAWCYYENNPQKYGKYGKLYNWFAVNDKRGLAPRGWRIPNEIDWEELIGFLGGEEEAGAKLKSSEGWGGQLGNGSNETQFNALPGGFRAAQFEFNTINFAGYWWESTDNNTLFAFYRTMSADNTIVKRSKGSKGNGFSVRCIKE